MSADEEDSALPSQAFPTQTPQVNIEEVNARPGITTTQRVVFESQDGNISTYSVGGPQPAAETLDTAATSKVPKRKTSAEVSAMIKLFI